jgi:hypothetical protein
MTAARQIPAAIVSPPSAQPWPVGLGRARSALIAARSEGFAAAESALTES